MDTSLFHSLEGRKVYFKALSIKDAEAIHSYASDEDVNRFIGWNLMKTLKETQEFIQTMINREEAGTHLYASVVSRETEEVIGTVMLFDFDQEANQGEIGYVFHKDHWCKGYGTESVALVSDFAFKSLKLHKLHASVVDVNFSSAKILEKNGYVLEGRLRDHFFIEGRYYDSLLLGKIQNK